MERGVVFFNGINAGIIERTDYRKYVFEYDDAYFSAPSLPAISLTLPKTRRRYEADEMFPFFCGLLAEGVNKDIQCRLLKIDEEDDFTRLLKTSGSDTIGAITIKEENK